MSQGTTTEPAQSVQIALDEIIEGPADAQRESRSADITASLANSINRLGILTPLILRKQGDKYETVAGGYRRDAARVAGHTHVPAFIIDCDDGKAWEISTIENMQRHNLSPLEEAEMIRVAHVTHKMSLERIAAAHGRSTAWCEDRLAMLSWDPLILHAVHTGALSKAAATPLARIRNEKIRHGLLDNSVRFGATARQTAQWANSAELQEDSTQAPDIDELTGAPAPTVPRLVSTCWMCFQQLGIERMQHLPTCPICIDTIERQRELGPQPTPDANPATARSNSSAVTPA